MPPIAQAESKEAPTTALETGAVYRGRAIVSYPGFVVTRSAVLSELAKYGITPASVWFKEKELPADWPANARSDESSTFTTQIYLEGLWGKPSGTYQTSGNGWRMYDHWLHKPSLKAEPAAPSCRPQGAGCDQNAQCCSAVCSSGVCGPWAPPSVVLPDCMPAGAPCDQVKCCEGAVCGKDNGGFFAGSWCDSPKPKPGQTPDAGAVGSDKDKRLAVTTGAIVVGGAIVVAGVSAAAALAKALFASREMADAQRLLDRARKPTQP